MHVRICAPKVGARLRVLSSGLAAGRQVGSYLLLNNFVHLRATSLTTTACSCLLNTGNCRPYLQAMHVIAVEKQHTGEPSERASSASLDNVETEMLLPSSPARLDIDEQAQKPKSISDHESWYQQPKQECLRYTFLES